MIHLQSGKWGGNYKELSVKSILKLLNKLNFKNKIFLTGLSNHYSQDLSVIKNEYDCVDYVDKFPDIFDWMNLVYEADMVISPEGFPAFFSMSLNIPTIFVYIHPIILRRLNINWIASSYPVNNISYSINNKLDYFFRSKLNFRPKKLSLPCNEKIVSFIKESIEL